MARSVHGTLWLVNEIALAKGDTCIVTGSNRAADEVDMIRMGTPFNRAAFFRVIVPGVSGSGRGFTRIIIDESFNRTDRWMEDWFMNAVAPRLLAGGDVRYQRV